MFAVLLSLPANFVTAFVGVVLKTLLHSQHQQNVGQRVGNL